MFIYKIRPVLEIIFMQHLWLKNIACVSFMNLIVHIKYNNVFYMVIEKSFHVAHWPRNCLWLAIFYFTIPLIYEINCDSFILELYKFISNYLKTIQLSLNGLWIVLIETLSGFTIFLKPIISILHYSYKNITYKSEIIRAKGNVLIIAFIWI